jgi:quercetin dioxygenase-like cupin family protein
MNQLPQNTERNVPRLLSQIKDYYSPRVIGEVDNVYIKITKVNGNAVPWHSHDNEDEMFFIIEGSLVMEIAGDEPFTLSQGDFHIVKKGTKHRVSSDKECTMILVEGKTAKHTGDVPSEITRSIEDQLT